MVSPRPPKINIMNTDHFENVACEALLDPNINFYRSEGEGEDPIFKKRTRNDTDDAGPSVACIFNILGVPFHQLGVSNYIHRIFYDDLGMPPRDIKQKMIPSSLNP